MVHRIAEKSRAPLVLGLLREAFTAYPRMRPIRIELPIRTTDPLAWLAAQSDPVKTYWRNRSASLETAGAGAAHCVASDEEALPPGPLFAALRANLSVAHCDMRYYGGMAFDAAQPVDPEWRPFNHYRFVIPRFEVFTRHGETFFACNTRCDPLRNDEDELNTIAADAMALNFDAIAWDAAAPTVETRRNLPDYAEWSQRIADIVGGIAGGAFEKVVLARKCLLEFGTAPNPLWLLHEIKKKSRNCYFFCFQPEDGRAFIGASPERLYRCVGGYVQSEALAATRPRGDSRTADNVFARELLHNEKELREHQFVVESIQRVFDALCRETKYQKKASLVKLRECQHLICRFEGLLHDGKTDADLLDALHPTPAVAGHPTREAVDWLAANEPFNRGWYAGPVGWVGSNASEFAMGIRSARVERNVLSLYSGAGIVAGSVADQEWTEVETKLAPFLSVLTS